MIFDNNPSMEEGLSLSLSLSLSEENSSEKEFSKVCASRTQRDQRILTEKTITERVSLVIPARDSVAN
jgi:hypothetical protein